MYRMFIDLYYLYNCSTLVQPFLCHLLCCLNELAIVDQQARYRWHWLHHLLKWVLLPTASGVFFSGFCLELEIESLKKNKNATFLAVKSWCLVLAASVGWCMSSGRCGTCQMHIQLLNHCHQLPMVTQTKHFFFYNKLMSEPKQCFCVLFGSLCAWITNRGDSHISKLYLLYIQTEGCSVKWQY